MFPPQPEYKIADPICTFLFSIFVLGTTVTILRDILTVLMEGAPVTLSSTCVHPHLENRWLSIGGSWPIGWFWSWPVGGLRPNNGSWVVAHQLFVGHRSVTAHLWVLGHLWVGTLQRVVGRVPSLGRVPSAGGNPSVGGDRYLSRGRGPQWVRKWPHSHSARLPAWASSIGGTL